MVYMYQNKAAPDEDDDLSTRFIGLHYLISFLIDKEIKNLEKHTFMNRKH